MKKILSVVMAIGMTVASQAIDTIYQVSKKEAKNILCYYQSGRFYADSNRKNCLYHHPGNMAAKGSLAKPDSSIYRFMGDKAYKGYSIKKEDCLASIVATKTVKGNTVNAKIYQGFAIARDKVPRHQKRR